MYLSKGGRFSKHICVCTVVVAVVADAVSFCSVSLSCQGAAIELDYAVAIAGSFQPLRSQILSSIWLEKKNIVKNEVDPIVDFCPEGRAFESDTYTNLKSRSLHCTNALLFMHHVFA